jgi:putative Mg2+ transporter-C (MgtC) family protein
MSLEEQLDLSLRLILAMVLGIMVGFEREYRGRDAGLRTMAMVCVGSCIFTIAGQIVAGKNVDPTRIAAQIVTGVGFLGAGAIFRAEDRVKGLTTAAAVWVVAAIGMLVGFGFYLMALVATLVVLVGLVGMRPIERRFFGLDKAGHPEMHRENTPT